MSWQGTYEGWDTAWLRWVDAEGIRSPRDMSVPTPNSSVRTRNSSVPSPSGSVVRRQHALPNNCGSLASNHPSRNFEWQNLAAVSVQEFHGFRGAIP